MSTTRWRPDWEVQAVSTCFVVIWVVVTVCVIILAIFGTMFGVATMKAHWP